MPLLDDDVEGDVVEGDDVVLGATVVLTVVVAGAGVELAEVLPLLPPLVLEHAVKQLTTAIRAAHTVSKWTRFT